MDRSSRLGRRRLSLTCLAHQLYITLSLFLLFQAGCNSPISLGRWRSNRLPPPEQTRPADGITSAHPGNGTAKPENQKAPEAALAAKKPAPFPESIIAPPDTDTTSGQLKYDTVVFGRMTEPASSSGWQYRLNRDHRVVGFEFSNRGGNRILPNRYDIAKNLLFTRDFQFRFDDRARQDIHLAITDWAPSADRQFRLSELMNSVMHFFPRNYLPAISTSAGRYTVTLPTGEQIQFDAMTHEILSGVLSEAPVDLTPNRAARKFPAVNYSGKGVVVRANARGADPRIGTTATITTGSPAADCKGKNCEQCQVPSRELWSQNGAVRFKFPTDAAFDRYLRSRCGFGLPILDPDVVIASTSNN